MAHLNSTMTPLDKGALAARIRAGETTIGSFAGLGSTMAIEVLAAAGLDWILVDLEHGGGSEDGIGNAVAAAGGYGAGTFVRVETPDRIRIGRALDAGAAGVMLPRVDSADEVATIIPHVHYPPLGDRGVATYNRSLRWGMDKDALQTSDSEVITIVQIETTGALAEVDEIASIDAVDVLFVGPLDLSYALGVPLDFTAPAFLDALEAVVAAARKHGKSAGILSADAGVASTRAGQGFTFLPVGSDSTLLADTATAVISALRD
ncbi:2,4-dihydroxyhept-2-ene-1,7-dioic acid aldolase [Brevibacterium sediminis]|uniref:2,4-dihydroxyhept-2-ene-1,7-dioic acid aldolase n=1 Tax=Brevibacterium sediminis TaxID=1857024 RepID=A0ABQ1LS13_9MICO|nr:aldolase/citrate lyase family protein [Brevibacterium sediminis]GGC28863.1 2,4-dihydroxyhept-2-ene-1,7-dioic acid aldolase [Brevibacterium sediminis]